MLIDYQNGQTSIIIRVKIRNSSVATGAGLTGLVNSSSGLIISTIADNEASATAYTAAGSTIDTITTLGTYGTITAGHCQFKQVDSTNHPGIYEVQIANARFAVSNAKSLLISIVGATNAADCDVVIPLRTVNPYNGNFGVTGLTGLTAPTAGALPTIGTSSGQINLTSGGVDIQTWLTHAVTAATNGIPDVNAKNIGNATASYFTNTARGTDAASNTIQLAASESNNPLWCELDIVGGTGASQKSVCIAVTGLGGSTPLATVWCYQGTGGNWVTKPDNTSQYAIGQLVFPIDASGRPKISGPIPVNVATPILFFMHQTNSQAGYVGAANTITVKYAVVGSSSETTDGSATIVQVGSTNAYTYTPGSASILNGGSTNLRFSATGAVDTEMTVVMTP